MLAAMLAAMEATTVQVVAIEGKEVVDALLSARPHHRTSSSLSSLPCRGRSAQNTLKNFRKDCLIPALPGKDACANFICLSK